MFNKSQLLTLHGGEEEEVDLMTDLLRRFEALDILIDRCAREEFIYIDDKNNKVFSQEMETMQTTLGWHTARNCVDCKKCCLRSLRRCIAYAIERF